MTTYGQLTTDVDSWLTRDDLKAGSDIATITRVAEATINRDVRTMAQERNVTLVADGRQTVAPTDFVSARTLDIDSNQTPRIDYQTPEVLRKHPAWSNGSNIQFYTLEGKINDLTDTDVYFTWAPAGNASTPTNVELAYFVKWPALVEDVDTNWLLANQYDIYLWAMCHSACVFLQEKELAMDYLGKYEIAKSALALSENRKRFRGQTHKGWNSPRVIV